MTLIVLCLSRIMSPKVPVWGDAISLLLAELPGTVIDLSLAEGVSAQCRAFLCGGLGRGTDLMALKPVQREIGKNVNYNEAI